MQLQSMQIEPMQMQPMQSEPKQIESKQSETMLGWGRPGRGGRCWRALVAGLLLAVTGAATAGGETVEIVADRDNTLYESSTGTLSNGAGAFVFAGNTGQLDSALSTRRAVLHFDVASAIPAGSLVTGATLRLYLSKAPNSIARTVSVFRLLADWGEGTSADTQGEGSGTAATTDDATWLYRFYPHHTWAAAGGDFTPTASASTAVAAAGQFYTWTSSALAADVQAFVDTPGANFGWLLAGDESTPRTAKRFSSRQDASNGGTQRPRLTVTFTPPAASGACCAGSGGCSLVTAAACSASGGVFQGNATSCSPNPCPQPTGACCLGNGTCQRVTSAQCSSLGGSYRGNDTTCATAGCTLAAGACCLPGQPGSCGTRTATQCTAAAGSYLGDNTTCGVDLCPFVDPLPFPAVAEPTVGSVGGAATYELAITEERQQLHRDLPDTTVWTYGGSYPGPTIEARVGEPVHVEWQNDLRVGGSLRVDHLLPVDTCLHGPDHHGDAPRTVVHLHGGHLPAASDGHPEDTILPGESDLFEYPNQQLPATLWYHDHALGITRLNVYAGLAGLYLLRDDAEVALGLPSGDDEVPLVLQDRTFAADGSLAYPDSWVEHVFGDKILVNGKVWPYLEVPRGKVRFRVLNGANSRTFRLALDNGATLRVIGTEGGLLPAPVTVSTLTLTPGERADVVIDFAGYSPGTVLHLVNDAPAPFPGTPGVGVVAQVLELRVQEAAGHTAALPAVLRPLERLDPAAAVRTRTFELAQGDDPCTGSRWTINGLDWDEITEYPVLGTTEIWSFVNRSGMVHPMHLHLSMFQVLDRQSFELVGGEVVPTGVRRPPAPAEDGWKDTVATYPFEITRVIVRFENYPGLFAYHCHILEHEDHEMMRQFQTVERAADACVPDADTLCIDDQPGDRRFRVEITFDTVLGGGQSGNAQAITLADKGVGRGGLFWFFNASNPELLIKVLNGCAINGNYWVFFSAGTNVGLTLTVTDTVTGQQFVRTNADRNPVPTVQALDALTCQ